jgi:hypothetical protein
MLKIERFFARRLVKIMGQIFFCRSAEKFKNSSELLVWFFSVQQSARGKKIGGRKIFFNGFVFLIFPLILNRRQNIPSPYRTPHSFIAAQIVLEAVQVFLLWLGLITIRIVLTRPNSSMNNSKEMRTRQGD